MLLDLVQSFLRATLSNEFTEVSITSMHACTIWILHTSVYDCTFNDRRIACTFKLFTPLASFSYATWSSATFLASLSQRRICWNFYTPMVSITLQRVGLGLFTASSPILPSLYRLKPCIFKLFQPLSSFSYGIWSSSTFLASCSEPWTCGKFNTLFLLRYRL